MRMTIFVVFSAFLMLSLNLEVEARCYTNGCSVPGNLPYFYKRRFTPACNKHDVCYACISILIQTIRTLNINCISTSKNFAMRMTIFVVLSAFLMLSLNLEVEARCYPNGCSIPGNLPYFYKRRFTPACNKHDVCYACGTRNGWSRFQCDRAFKHDMDRLCRPLNWAERPFCYAAAVDYYNAVRLFGSNSYDKPSLWWCRYCPKSNGDPNKALGR